MPEGVEVRTHIDAIKKFEGLTITGINYYKPMKNMFNGFKPIDLMGQKVMEIFNKGKSIFWVIDNYSERNYLLIHFSMSGSFRFNEDKHNILKIEFENGECLYYNDIRHFGKWTHMNPFEFKKKYDELGPDLLELDDIEIGNIIKTIKKKYLKVPIKEFLMNQNIVGGIGNIYATEALFKVGILPTKTVLETTPIKVFELLKAAQDIMKKSYELGGMSVYSFKNAEGEVGNAKDLLQIYGKIICPKCGNELIKINVSGRSTVYCSNCQK